MGILTDLVQAIPAILTGLKGKNLKPQQEVSGRLGELAQAQMDPSSPTFQNLYKQNRQAGEQNLAETISEISGQNRKLVSMGRAPLLDQERGGESVFRNLIKSQQGIDDTARSNTFSQLGNASNAYTGQYNALNKDADLAYDNKVKRASAFGNIADVMRGIQNPGRSVPLYDPNDIAAATAPKAQSDLSLPMGGDLQSILKKLIGA